MPNWHGILSELQRAGSTHDIIRRKYLRELHQLTGRNVIIYYSGWLQKPGLIAGLDDSDKNGFMTVIDSLDCSKGLDLLLHTPGGEAGATEALVDYLHAMFGINIRAIVPQLAMSAGTMIACACKEIMMGKQSSLGPIDPQIRGVACHGVVEEFKNAYTEIKADKSKIDVWQPIIAKYPPAFIGECKKAIEWTQEMVKEWLLKGMLCNKENANEIADKIIEELGSHALTKSHTRHLSVQTCQNAGLTVLALEDDPKLQEAVLSVHHSCIHTLASTPASKITENHRGVAFIQLVEQVVVKR